MRLIIKNETNAPPVYDKIVRQAIGKASRLVHCLNGIETAVIFVGDEKMRKLNLIYRKKNKTTNVLSFPTHSSCLIPHAPCDLGDIFICVPQARREAKKCGLTMKYQIARLALHGFLHLLGYDHENKKEARKMERVEEGVLEELT